MATIPITKWLLYVFARHTQNTLHTPLLQLFLLQTFPLDTCSPVSYTSVTIFFFYICNKTFFPLCFFSMHWKCSEARDRDKSNLTTRSVSGYPVDRYRPKPRKTQELKNKSTTVDLEFYV